MHHVEHAVPLHVQCTEQSCQDLRPGCDTCNSAGECTTCTNSTWFIPVAGEVSVAGKGRPAGHPLLTHICHHVAVHAQRARLLNALCPWRVCFGLQQHCAAFWTPAACWHPCDAAHCRHGAAECAMVCPACSAHCNHVKRSALAATPATARGSAQHAPTARGSSLWMVRCVGSVSTPPGRQPCCQAPGDLQAALWLPLQRRRVGRCLHIR
jgi:hypothetical protein